MKRGLTFSALDLRVRCADEQRAAAAPRRTSAVGRADYTAVWIYRYFFTVYRELANLLCAVRRRSRSCIVAIRSWSRRRKTRSWRSLSRKRTSRCSRNASRNSSTNSTSNSSAPTRLSPSTHRTETGTEIKHVEIRVFLLGDKIRFVIRFSTTTVVHRLWLKCSFRSDSICPSHTVMIISINMVCNEDVLFCVLCTYCLSCWFCLFIISEKPHFQTWWNLSNFWQILSMTIDRSLSGGIAMRYVFPVCGWRRWRHICTWLPW